MFRFRSLSFLAACLLPGLVLAQTLTQTNPDGTVFTQNGPRSVGPNIQPAAGSTVGATLFNYGLGAGDTAVARDDDNSAQQSWVGTGPAGSSLSLPFYGNRYGGDFINTNGNVSFGAGVSAYTGQPFPYSTAPMIAPFWADVDTRGTNSGQVWYRTVQDSASLTAIAARVNSSFLGNIGFTPTFAQVVTWDHVGYFNSQSDRLNTFQAVIASDGVRTFTLFLYPNQAIWWDRGSASPAGSFASVGFDAGDGVNFYNAVGSRTSSMRDLWFLTATVPANPGVQAFRIDGTTITATPDSVTAGPTQVLSSNLALPAATGTVFSTLQLSANATGYTISSSAANGSLQFDKLTFVQPTDTVTFSGAGVYLTNAADAITQGNLVFTGTSALVARTTGAVNGGTLTLKDSSTIYLWSEAATTGATKLTFDKTTGGTGGTFDLRGYNTAIGALNSVGTAAGVITNSGSTASTLTIDSAASGNFNGTIQNGSSGVAVTKLGSGTQILSGTNTYTGATTVSAGILQFGKTASLYNGATGSWTAANLTIAAGATAAFNVGGSGEFTSANIDSLRSVGFAAGANLGLDTTNAPGGTYTYSNLTDTAAGSLGLVKLGTGILTLAGTNTYSGGTSINGGLIRFNALTELGTGAVTLNGGGLQWATGVTTDITGQAQFNRVLGAGGGTFDTNGNNVSFAASLSGTGGLTKTGAGTLTLAGANTYTGTTTISTGTLTLAHALALQGSNYNSSGGGILDFGTLTSATFGGLTGTQALALTNASSAAVALTVSGSQTSTPYLGALTGAGSLIKSGSGTLTLSGTNSYAGTTTISAGTLQFSKTASLYNGATGAWTAANLTIAAGATAAFNVGGSGEFTSAHIDTLRNAGFSAGANLGLDTTNATGGTFTYASNLTDTAAGSLGLVKLGTGVLTLSGTNSYTGATTISAGTLTLGASNALPGGSAVTIASGATLNAANFSGSLGSLAGAGSVTLGSGNLSTGSDHTSTTLSGVISGTGALTKSGAGTLTLTGTNAYSGGTTISGGTLQLGSGGTSGSIVGNITNNGSLIFNRSDAVTFSGIISGAGALTLSGPGSLTLSAANTFTGGTTISAGTLVLSANDRLTSTGAMTLTGGTLSLPGVTQTVGALTLTSGSITGIGTLTASSIAASAGTVDAVLAGSAALTKTGSGSLILTNANTYSGGTTISGGTLQLGTGGASGSIIGDIVNNGSLVINRSSALTLSGAISGSGSVTKLTASTLTLTGTNTYSGGTTLSAGTLQIGSGGTAGSIVGDVVNNAALVFNRSNASTYAGAISGTGSFTKSGAGTLTLTGANTYSGTTMINGGTLAVEGGNNRLSATSSLFLIGGSTLNLADTTQTVAALGSAATRLAGDITAGTLVNQAATYLQSGTFAATFAGNAATARLWIGGDASATVFLTGTNDTVYTTDHNQVIIGNVATGAAGTVKLGNANALAAATENIQIFSGTLDLNGQTAVRGNSIAFKSGTAGSLINSNTAATASYGGSVSFATGITAKFGGAGDVVLSGVLTGAGPLLKSGAGILTLTGANTYTGGTTLSAGALQIGNGGTTGSIVGNITNNAALIFNRSDATSYSGIISGTGSLTKTGTGTLSFSTTHTYSGGTTVTGGLINFSSLANFGSGTIALNGGGLHWATGTTIDASSRLAALGSSGGTFDTNGNNVTFASILSGTGGLTKSGSGTLTLSAANTYTGNTTINAGTLVAARNGQIGTFKAGTTVTVNSGGTLVATISDSLGWGSGNANLVINGGTVTTDTSTGQHTTLQNVTMTGGLLTSAATDGRFLLNGPLATTASSSTAVINAPYLDLLSGWTSGVTTSFTVAQGSTVSGIDLNISSAVIGTGPVTKLGAGTLRLTGANTYTGATSVNAGTLLVNGSLANTAVSVANGGTLGGSGSIAGLTTIASGGHLAPGNSPGTLTFTNGLALQAGSSLDFELGTTSDLIRVSGGTLSGPSSGLVTLNVSNAGGFTAGTYTLFDFTSAATSSFDVGDFTFGTTIPGYTYALAFAGSTLALTATASAIPEPSTYAALAGALALGLAALRRRSRR